MTYVVTNKPKLRQKYFLDFFSIIFQKIPYFKSSHDHEKRQQFLCEKQKKEKCWKVSQKLLIFLSPILSFNSLLENITQNRGLPKAKVLLPKLKVSHLRLRLRPKNSPSVELWHKTSTFLIRSPSTLMSTCSSNSEIH